MLKKVKEEAFKYFRNITEQVSKKGINACEFLNQVNVLRYPK